MAGQMVHYEIPVDDIERASEFWGSLFGWKFQAYEGAPGGYHTAQIGEQMGVAISGGDPGKRGTRSFFDVEDVNAGAARVRELGGEAGGAMPVPAMGWFVVCKDTEGNEFGLWQTDESAPAPTG